MENYTFVLVEKERALDAQLYILAAGVIDDIDKLYELAQSKVQQHCDLLMYTYLNAQLVEISLYKPELEDFEVLVDCNKQERVM